MSRPLPGAQATRSQRLARASLGSGAGTILSRVTGLLRLGMITYALGGGIRNSGLGDPFNLANNTPNMIHDLVLGGVLAATFVPVFVGRVASRSEREATESISAVVSVSLVLLVIATVLFELASPAIIDLYTIHSSTVTASERAFAVELLRLFAPQLFFYGAISLMSAVLASRDRFGAVGIAPVLNNVVGIFVLALFAVIAHGHDVVSIEQNTALIWFLGIGTTLGVTLQAAALLPSMRHAGIRLRFVWRPADPAIKTILSLSGWTFGFVAGNQLAVFIVLAIAARSPGFVSAYTYAFTFFSFPFAVVAVAVVNVATPDFARAYTLGDFELLGRRFGAATRKVLALVLPAMVGYLLLAQPVIQLTLQHGQESFADTHLTASVLVMFALGLPGFCLFFLAIRAFQSMQDTRTAFVLYGLENATNILAAFLLFGPLGVRGLALSYSIAYSIAAVVALAVLRERLGTLGGRSLVQAGARSAVISLVMAVAVAFATAVVGTGTGIGGWVRLLFVVFVGLAVYLVCAGLAASLHAWQTSRRH